MMLFSGVRWVELKDGALIIKRSGSCHFADINVTVQIEPSSLYRYRGDQDSSNRIYQEGIFDIADILTKLAFEIVQSGIDEIKQLKKDKG